MPLDQSDISLKLKNSQIQLVVEQSVDSTNTYLKNCKPSNANDIMVCIAEQQTQGRGRLNRPWQSPFGENVYCSFKLPYQESLLKLSGLSLAVSVALHNVLNSYLKTSDLKIKWPNDVLFTGKKLAGILIEIDKTSSGETFIIIGIGINVNMLTDSENKITQAWTSLKEILTLNINRNEIIAELIEQTITTWTQFLEMGLTPFMAYYHQQDFLLNQLIKVESGHQLYEGIATGINEQGYLNLRLATGENIHLHSGEAKILK